MKEKIKQKINEIKGLKKYRPDKNSVCFDNGSELGWQIKPKKDKTEFNFEFDRNFENLFNTFMYALSTAVLFQEKY